MFVIGILRYRLFPFDYDFYLCFIRMADEIEYNSFFYVLQNKFRKKYEAALSQCWMVCIPCSASIRGIEITESFVDLHLLKPDPYSLCHYLSTDSANAYSFHLEGNFLILQKAPIQLLDDYVSKILSMETGYNKDFHQYKILIIDKPLSPHYQVAPIDQDVFLLNQTITCLNEAVQFLGQFPGHCEVMARLNSDLHNVCATLKGESPLLAREKMYELIKAQWRAFLGTHPVDRQRSGHFQNQLTIALENWVVNCLHEVLFPLVCAHYQLEDEHILTRAIDLASAGVTADQLGASQHFAVPLPAAVVELASLDTLTCPVDKLTCLHTVVDLIFAQIKAAIGDAHCTDDTFITEENHFPTMTTDDLIPLLITVIIQAKPIHAASNLFYIENFQWTLSPNDAVSFSLVTFKAALQELLQLNPDHLRPRNEKVLHELGIDDLIEVSSKVCERLSQYGSTQAWSPLDKHLQRTIAMIEASTLEADLPTHSSTSNIEKSQFR